MDQVNHIEPPAEGTTRTIKLKSRHGMPQSVHLLDAHSALLINAAIAAQRPVLLRGDPGVGKSQLARAAAEVLKRALITHTVNSRTETDELLFTVDLVARLAEAQSHRRRRRNQLDLKNFIRPGPIWWALDWASATRQLAVYQRGVLCSSQITLPDTPSDNGVVVLIDELDKADSSVPNGLLDALGHRGFEVPGVGRISQAQNTPPPLVIFTTNRERRLPDAFLRRCLVHTLAQPDASALYNIAVAHNDREAHGLADDVLRQAVDQIATERSSAQGPQQYRPGVAELLDLLAAVAHAPDPAALLTKLTRFIRKDR